MHKSQLIFLLSTFTALTTAESCQWTLQRIPDAHPKPGAYKNSGKVLLNRNCQLGGLKYSDAALNLNLCLENRDGKLTPADNGDAFASCDVDSCFWTTKSAAPTIVCNDCGGAKGPVSANIDTFAKFVGKNGQDAACFTHTATATTSTARETATGSK